jgi:hypothetical protein
MPAPLWDLFSDDRQLSCFILNIYISLSPQYLNPWSQFDELTRARLVAICKQSLDTDLLMHEPERWAALETLPPSERPLAMATRLLQTCIKHGKVGFLCLGEDSGELLRHRHLVHIWIALRVTTLVQVTRWEESQKASDLDDEQYLTGRSIFPWVRAANSIRAALIEVASSKEDECLTVILSRYRKVENSCSLSRTGYEKIVRSEAGWPTRGTVWCEGRHRSVPPAISEQMADRLWPDGRWIVPRCSPWRG